MKISEGHRNKEKSPRGRKGKRGCEQERERRQEGREKEGKKEEKSCQLNCSLALFQVYKDIVIFPQ